MKFGSTGPAPSRGYVYSTERLAHPWGTWPGSRCPGTRCDGSESLVGDVHPVARPAHRASQADPDDEHPGGLEELGGPAIPRRDRAGRTKAASRSVSRTEWSGRRRSVDLPAGPRSSDGRRRSRISFPQRRGERVRGVSEWAARRVEERPVVARIVGRLACSLDRERVVDRRGSTSPRSLRAGPPAGGPRASRCTDGRRRCRESGPSSGA